MDACSDVGNKHVMMISKTFIDARTVHGKISCPKFRNSVLLSASNDEATTIAELVPPAPVFPNALQRSVTVIRKRSAHFS